MAQHLRVQRFEAIRRGIMPERQSWIMEENYLPIIEQSRLDYFMSFFESLNLDNSLPWREEELLQSIIRDTVGDEYFRLAHTKLSTVEIKPASNKLQPRPHTVYGSPADEKLNASPSRILFEVTPQRLPNEIGTKLDFKNRKRCRHCASGFAEKCERLQSNTKKANIALEALAKWSIQRDTRKPRRRRAEVRRVLDKFQLKPSPLRHVASSAQSLAGVSDEGLSKKFGGAHQFLTAKLAREAKACRRAFGMYVLKGVKEAYVGERGVYSPGKTLRDITSQSNVADSREDPSTFKEEDGSEETVTTRPPTTPPEPPASTPDPSSATSTATKMDRCVHFVSKAGHSASSKDSDPKRRLRMVRSGLFIDCTSCGA